MNLHEAIEQVFLLNNTSQLPSDVIAQAINTQRLYERWGGSPVEASLVEARAKSKVNLFTVRGSVIILKSTEPQFSLEKLGSLLTDALRGPDSFEIQELIAFLLFYTRTSQLSVSEQFWGSYSVNTLFPLSADTDIKQHLANALNHIKGNTNFGHSFSKVLSGLEKLVNFKLLPNLINILKVFSLGTEEYSPIIFSEFFDNFLNSYTSYTRSFRTPVSVTKLISQLLDIQPGQSILNAFASNGNLLSQVVRDKNINGNLFVQAVDSGYEATGVMSLILSGATDFNYQVTSPLPQSKIVQYNYIIACPPLGVRGSDNNPILPSEYIPTQRLELAALQFMVRSLMPAGKAILLIPNGLLSGSSRNERQVFESLIQEDLVESVIALPQDVLRPFVRVQVSLLLLNRQKSKTKKQKVLFQKLSNLNDLTALGFADTWGNLSDNAKVIDNSLIQKQDYNLSANRYISPIQFPEGNFKSLGELVIIKRGVTIPSENRLPGSAIAVGEGVPYIGVKDLPESSLNPVIKSHDVNEYVLKNEVETTRFISKNTILMAHVGNKLKPALYSGEQPALADSNLFTLTLKSDFNTLPLFETDLVIKPLYLLSQLYQPYVVQQFDALRTGSVIPAISMQDTQKVQIRMPDDLKEQDRVIEDFFRKSLDGVLDYSIPEENEDSIDIIRKNEETIQELRQDLIEMSTRLKELEKTKEQELKDNEKQEMNILMIIKHEFGNLMSPAGDDLSLMRSFLQSKATNTTPFIWTESITPPLPLTIAQLFKSFEDRIKNTVNLFDEIKNLIQFGNTSLNHKQVNLFALIHEEDELQKNDYKNFTVHYPENEEILVELDEYKFRYVIRNFILNTLKHGTYTYPDPFGSNGEELTKNSFNIIFNVSMQDNGYLTLDMLNDGKPFPDNFTIENFTAFGIRESNEPGSGIGGYLMNKIIEAHGSKLEIVPTNNLFFPIFVGAGTITNTGYYENGEPYEYEEDVNYLHISMNVHLRIVDIPYNP